MIIHVFMYFNNLLGIILLFFNLFYERCCPVILFPHFLKILTENLFNFVLCSLDINYVSPRNVVTLVFNICVYSNQFKSTTNYHDDASQVAMLPSFISFTRVPLHTPCCIVCNKMLN